MVFISVSGFEFISRQVYAIHSVAASGGLETQFNGAGVLAGLRDDKHPSVIVCVGAAVLLRSRGRVGHGSRLASDVEWRCRLPVVEWGAGRVRGTLRPYDFILKVKSTAGVESVVCLVLEPAADQFVGNSAFDKLEVKPQR